MKENDFIKLKMLRSNDEGYYYYSLKVIGTLYLTSSCSDEGKWKLFLDDDSIAMKEITIDQATKLINLINEI